MIKITATKEQFQDILHHIGEAREMICQCNFDLDKEDRGNFEIELDDIENALLYQFYKLL